MLGLQLARRTTARRIRQPSDAFGQPGVSVCAHRVAVQTLLGGHGVDGLAAVQQQQGACTLSGSPVAAALHDVGQLLAVGFAQHKGAGFAWHGAILGLAIPRIPVDSPQGTYIKISL
jgi:hypothetical protein